MIVAIRGGLGNQLFQAAFARYLESQGQTILVDTRDYPVHDRIYMLDRCGFDFPVASPLQCDEALWRAGSRPGKIARKALARLNTKQKLPGLVTEDVKWKFNPELASYPNLSFFDGYWMSYHYAKKSGCEFPFIKDPTPESLKAWEPALLEKNSVAVHIRRGDYAQNEAVRKDYLVCDIPFYRQAMQHMAEIHPSCTFTLFSDDPAYITAQDWAPFDVRILSETPEVGDEKVLRLFSLAHHQIISNSTYSWWGAFLNQRPGKQVIAPDRWRSRLLSSELVGQMIPPNWLLFPSIN